MIGIQMSRGDLLAHFQDTDSESYSKESDDHAEEEEFREPIRAPVESVILIANDGVRFHVATEIVKVSGLLCGALGGDSEFAETVSGEIHLDQIRSIVLERVVDYMHHNFMWRNNCGRMPHFQVDPTITIETYIAADFLQL
jgi:transcription elongation factor B subunit 1